MKKLLSVLGLVTGVSLVFVGCGGGDETNVTVNNSPGNGSGDSASTSVPDVAGTWQRLNAPPNTTPVEGQDNGPRTFYITQNNNIVTVSCTDLWGDSGSGTAVLINNTISYSIISPNVGTMTMTIVFSGDTAQVTFVHPTEGTYQFPLVRVR